MFATEHYVLNRQMCQCYWSRFGYSGTARGDSFGSRQGGRDCAARGRATWARSRSVPRPTSRVSRLALRLQSFNPMRLLLARSRVCRPVHNDSRSLQRDQPAPCSIVTFPVAKKKGTLQARATLVAAEHQPATAPLLPPSVTASRCCVGVSGQRPPVRASGGCSHPAVIRVRAVHLPTHRQCPGASLNWLSVAAPTPLPTPASPAHERCRRPPAAAAWPRDSATRSERP